MSNKVSPSSTLIQMDGRGKVTVTILKTNPDNEGWKKWMWKEAKVVEACLYGETLNVGLVMSNCLKMSRNMFAQEVGKLRLSIDSSELHTLQVTPIPEANRKSKSMIFPISQKPVNPPHRSVIRISSNCDWKRKMVDMLLDMNKETVKAVRTFIEEHKARACNKWLEQMTVSSATVKADRAKMYELYHATSPSGVLSDPSKPTPPVSFLPLRILQTINSSIFPSDTSIPDRIRRVHSCIVLQHAFRMEKRKTNIANATRIQAWYRMVKAREKLIQLKLVSFKKTYFQARLKHWFQILAAHLRMRKGGNCVRTEATYLAIMPQILSMQKLARGYLTRKVRIPWVKTIWKLQSKCRNQTQLTKIAMWKSTKSLEDDVLKTASAVAEQMVYFQHTLRQGKKIKGFKSEKDLTAYVRSFEKAEARARKEKISTLAETRVRQLLI